MSIRFVQQFLKLESAGGILLFIAAIFSMVWVNSPLQYLHAIFKDQYLFALNDGLMTLFFLLVGLELKRGFLDGPLSQISNILLPAAAAIGGMVIPAGIYLIINKDHPAALEGWATPVATDIAFALGVLSLFGSRVPTPLKLFLLALAIFDDIGAILIIAVAYSHGVSFPWLSAVIGLMACMWILNFLRVELLSVYLALGVLLWVAVHHAGIHATIAGVLIAMMIPVTRNEATSPLHRLETRLHPWVVFGVMPLFALVNAGFSFHDLHISYIWDTIVVGIVLGLFVGKQLGVFGVSWLLIKLKLLKLPKHTSWLALYGVSLLCGIGFTMSLFLGTISFTSELYLSEVRMGVMIGSIISGLAGACILRIALNRKK